MIRENFYNLKFDPTNKEKMEEDLMKKNSGELFITFVKKAAEIPEFNALCNKLQIKQWFEKIKEIPESKMLYSEIGGIVKAITTAADNKSSEEEKPAPKESDSKKTDSKKSDSKDSKKTKATSKKTDSKSTSKKTDSKKSDSKKTKSTSKKTDSKKSDSKKTKSTSKKK